MKHATFPNGPIDSAGSTVKSHLYADGSDLVRVEYINGEIVVETYG